MIATSTASFGNMGFALISLLQLYNWTSSYMVVDQGGAAMYERTMDVVASLQKALPWIDIRKNFIKLQTVTSYRDMLIGFANQSRGKTVW